MMRRISQCAIVACNLLLAITHADAQTMMPLPNHASTYTGNIRGYWFTAPTDFVITGLRVPSQAGSGLQYIQVFKINDVTPVVYATTSTNFTTLHITYGATNGVIQAVNIPISAGDKIGIVGQAGNVNSYGTVSGTTNIGGNSVTLARIGYQGNMTSTGIANYWTEPASSSISRVEMYYTTCSTAVTQQPSSVTICESKQASFAITATDVTSYKWQVDEGSGFFDVTNSTHYAGATTNTLSVNNTPATFDGYQFRCLVSKGSGAACADTSDTVSLNVHGLVKAEPLRSSDTTCINAVKDIEVKSTGGIINYHWQVYNPITRVFEEITGQPPYMLMGNVLRITGAGDTLDGIRYRCIIDGICDTLVSNETRLTVLSIPKVGVQPQDITTEQGKDVVFEVQATGNAAKYRWQAAAANDTFSYINDGGIYNGVKTNRLKVSGVTRIQDGFQFRCEVRTSSSCNAPGDTSDFAVLYVTPAASVQGLANANELVVFPNPAGNELYIKTTYIQHNKALKYRVVDKTGKTLIAGDLATGVEAKIDVTKLPADIYLVEMQDESGQTLATSRFTKL
ncbi:MAG TPA: T9SS type A sorting domain-containing protein [Flavipsychrobacter sp.]